MKFNSYYIPLAVVLCISLFFACTSELELPVSPDKLVLCAYDRERVCAPLVDGQCLDGGILVQKCDYNSSDYNSSSSREVGNSSIGGSSSSADGNSSSSSSISLTPPPEIDDGPFEFRFFDYYDSEEDSVYYLGTTGMYASVTPSSEGHGKLFNKLKITNADEAKCEDSVITTIEVTGLEGYTTMPTTTQATVNKAGIITAYAVAVCDGKKDTLKIATARVVPDPIFSDCKLPSTYVYKDELVKNLVTVDNKYGRCADDATYTPEKYPAVASTAPQNFSTIASCGVTNITCSGLSITVANNYFKFDHEGGTKESIPNGTTVIEVLDSYDKTQNGAIIGKAPVTRLGCELYPAGSGELSIKINGGSIITNYWVEATLPAYATNGNRILLEKITPSPAVCIVMF